MIHEWLLNEWDKALKNGGATVYEFGWIPSQSANAPEVAPSTTFPVAPLDLDKTEIVYRGRRVPGKELAKLLGIDDEEQADSETTCNVITTPAT